MLNRIILKVETPAWSNEQKTMINCMVTFKITDDMPPVLKNTFKNPVPFNASPDDDQEHGRNLFKDLIKGKYGPIAPYQAPKKLEKIKVSIPGK